MRSRASDASSCLCTCARDRPRSVSDIGKKSFVASTYESRGRDREHLAEELLRGAVSVDVRRVDEVDPGVEGGVDARDGLVARARRRRRSATSRARSPRPAGRSTRVGGTASGAIVATRRACGAIVAKSAQMPSEPVRTVALVAKAAAVQFACTECGTVSGRWLGRCPGCGAFGTHGRGSRADPRRPACPGTAAASPRRRRRRGVRAHLHRASTSSTACSAAGSCPRRSCSSAASRASASRRCC